MAQTREKEISVLPVNSGLDENEAELGVLVLAVALKVRTDGNSLIGGLADYCKSRKKILHDLRTFLISMYRSSGSSGARPVKITLSVSTVQRH